ncbi:DEAD/DEAH box helicase family protein [bacterium]|nr:DEAD/DEAH box helicase family protein [bacterium]
MNIHLPSAGPLEADLVIAFDFETTGLNPRRDEIIEAGVVRLKAGIPVHTFSQLYNPTIPVPDIVTQLTGLSDKDLQGQPALEANFTELFEQFKGNWFVAHSASFDRGFLKNACKLYKIPFKGIDPTLVDTLELSRLLLPWLSNHRLETVASHFDVSLTKAHRAVHDAEAAGRIFYNLSLLACKMSDAAFERAYKLADGAKDGLRSYFDCILAYRKTHTMISAPPPEGRPISILGHEPDVDSMPGHGDTDPVNYFGPDGIMAHQWPQFEFRAPQLDMANAVEQAFKRDEFLVAEAGTGVGKTVAYLLPALFWSMEEKKRVVVATHTKTLQDQIFAKDLPLLRELLGGGFLAVLLKGRQNYLCQRRLETLIQNSHSRLRPYQRRSLLPLLIWAEETLTGDIEENGGFGKERNLDVWSQIHSDGRYCLGPLCEYYSSCYYQRVRKAAKKAHIVLINHALLFADIITGHGVLGDYSSLIVDESHQLERAATDSLAVSLYEWVFKDLIEKLKGKGSRQKGLIDWIFNWAGAKGLAQTRRMDYDKRCSDLAEINEQLEAAVSILFTKLGSHKALSVLGPMQKYRIRDRQKFFSSLNVEITNIIETLNRLHSTAVELSSWLDMDSDLADPDGMDAARQMEAVVQDLLSIKERMTLIIDGAGEEDICWAEHGRGREENTIFLKAVPLDIAKLLSDQLYPGIERCVMTSATLSIRGRFDYALQRMGLQFMDSDRITTKLFGSPFEFESQVKFFVPSFMTSPKSPQFSMSVASLLIQVFENIHCGSMVLFTSYKMLKEVYAAVKPTLSAKGVSLLGQSIDGSRSQLLRRFREDHSSVLFGTASFWEGVDVPGKALELLVLTKIPFDVPSEPVVEARTEAVQESTGNGFMNFAVPEAIVKVRQGFGRLIRSGNDHGAVLLLDPRVTQTRYGRFFLEALPVRASSVQSPEELIQGMQNWFNEKKL